MKLFVGIFIAALITAIAAVASDDRFIAFMFGSIALISAAMMWIYWNVEKEEKRLEELHRQDRERRWK